MNAERWTLLDEDDFPRQWYNIQADLPEPLPPMLDPKTKEPIKREDFERLFTKEIARQQFTTERWVPIPEEVVDGLIRLFRPTPLYRARRLEKYLNTPAEIYIKCEHFSPTGSMKANDSLPHAYYAREEGLSHVASDTGAGQWGSSLAMAASMYGLACTIFMVRLTSQKKPGRKTMMQLWGAEVIESPSNRTEFGKKLYNENPNHPGSLGIAISEVVEYVRSTPGVKYCVGSLFNFALLHQTVIGLEAMKQFELINKTPNVFVGCIGGGGNFGGFSYPFIGEKIKGKLNAEFVACEPAAVPSTTRGTYTYDYGNTAGTTPLIKMYTVGYQFAPAPIHAGGLRHHGKAPSLSYLINKGYIRTVAFHQTEVFEAAATLARTEGIITAPESAHGLKYVIDEAQRCKQTGEKKVIAFINSGHGLLDLTAYEDYLNSKLVDWAPKEITIPKHL